MSQNSSSSPPTKRRRPIAKTRKQYPVKVENLKYKVPQSIYEKAKKQIFGDEKKNNYEAGVRLKCHQVTYSKFNSLDPPNCRANFFEAAKQAMEDRNYKVLYEIISKSLKLRDSCLSKQMLEYMFLAIQRDPMQADNRGQLIDSFLTRVKLFGEDGHDAQIFLRDAHTFSNGNSDDEDISIDFDNISEASIAVGDILKTLEDHYSDDS